VKTGLFSFKHECRFYGILFPE